MDPDPIRQAFAAWYMNEHGFDFELLGGNLSEQDAFAAGAKWAAREAVAFLRKLDHDSLYANDRIADMLEEIRKHFGVEG